MMVLVAVNEARVVLVIGNRSQNEKKEGKKRKNGVKLAGKKALSDE